MVSRQIQLEQSLDYVQGLVRPTLVDAQRGFRLAFAICVGPHDGISFDVDGRSIDVALATTSITTKSKNTLESGQDGRRTPLADSSGTRGGGPPR